MLDRNDEPQYPIDAISLLCSKPIIGRSKISLPDMRAPGILHQASACGAGLYRAGAARAIGRERLLFGGKQ